MDGDEATEAARARVAALLEALSRIDLQIVVVGRPDQARLEARDAATEAAIMAGRGDLLYEATAAVRDAVMQMFARAGFNGTWAITDMAVSVTRADDRVAAAAAFEEAAMAEVVEDLVDKRTLVTLRSTSGELARTQGLPSPGSLSTIAAPGVGVVRTPTQVTILAIVVGVCAVVGFALGSATGLVLVFLGVAVVTATARYQSRR